MPRSPRLPLHRLLLLVVAAGAMLVALAAPIQSASADANTPADFVARINSLRASVGVQPLLVDGQLTGLAQSWAQHMAGTQTLAHSPSLSAGITETWAKLGENVGVGPDNATIWNAFIHSAEHYANLVDPSFNRVGVGVAVDGNGQEWTCHKFMDLVSASTPPATAAPAPVTRTATPVVHSSSTGHSATNGSTSNGSGSGAGSGSGSGSGNGSSTSPTTTAPPAPQPGPPPPASSERVAAVLAALRQLSN